MPRDWCPFCPGSGKVPEHYDIFLYPNDFAAFSPAYPPFEDKPGIFATTGSRGSCDVVLYHSGSQPEALRDVGRATGPKLWRLWCDRSDATVRQPRYCLRIYFRKYRRSDWRYDAASARPDLRACRCCRRSCSANSIPPNSTWSVNPNASTAASSRTNSRQANESSWNRNISWPSFLSMRGGQARSRSIRGVTRNRCLICATLSASNSRAVIKAVRMKYDNLWGFSDSSDDDGAAAAGKGRPSVFSLPRRILSRFSEAGTKLSISRAWSPAPECFSTTHSLKKKPRNCGRPSQLISAM